MFNKILIANRGEIACRVARTAKRLGIKTVAVYSSADQNAEHVKACDEAYWIGEAPASDSYLRGDKILEIAKLTGAEAIHPGYGFLSENAPFAEQCAEAGIVFIGPPVKAIIAMGLKSESKRLMQEAGVPLVPGYHGADQSVELLSAESKAIGYPQLIKASAGGGGKGMRVVNSFAEFADALASAKREAISSFGNDSVLIERYLQKPRHVELQVFADTHGHVVHLFERDCSIQRRHQKVIEEAPAPHMTPELRDKMGQAAINAAKVIDYVGAGTVEFLLDEDSGEFFFMEMNTRLQVEHPVTEMITRQDLVEWQLRVAFGEKLPCSQSDLQIHGHAFEARVYAENTERDFLPSTGTIQTLIAPPTNEFVRIDTGIVEGDEVSMYYDPMIAKLIVWGADRTQALKRLQAALGDYYIGGLHTNLAFLREIAHNADFAAEKLDTHFIAKHQAELFPPAAEIPVEVWATAALVEQADLQNQTKQNQSCLDPYSPWGVADAWQMNLPAIQPVAFQSGENIIHLSLEKQGNQQTLKAPQGDFAVKAQTLADQHWQIVLGDKTFKAKAQKVGTNWLIFWSGKVWTLALHNALQSLDEQAVHGGGLTAPMPGAVLEIKVAVGDEVKAGDALMIMVAMKMEHTITAPKAGKVEALYFQVGDQVKDGDILLELN